MLKSVMAELNKPWIHNHKRRGKYWPRDPTTKHLLEVREVAFFVLSSGRVQQNTEVSPYQYHFVGCMHAREYYRIEKTAFFFKGSFMVTAVQATLNSESKQKKFLAIVNWCCRFEG